MHIAATKKKSGFKTAVEKIAALEFSKKIFLFVAAAAVVIVIFAMVMIWRTEDTEPLNVLIPAVFAALATGEGFYYNKAKAENKIKLMKENGIEPTEKTFADDDYFESEE